ncbi:MULTISPECIES: hypothetical protein [Methylotuvimicrobium]|uniref:Uncharacterized protein n=1 Tax=Methylotuvimicrobium buryatense TaxID=95641 RepID=A0A4P9UJ06_METBY|nr:MULTISPECIES: hypothetical protein [Methylotuvimicrobium]QCW81084.1 hypothetical protein EQU24_01570 [Methylotuvimicrobium buryatense]
MVDLIGLTAVKLNRSIAARRTLSFTATGYVSAKVFIPLTIIRQRYATVIVVDANASRVCSRIVIK